MAEAQDVGDDPVEEALTHLSAVAASSASELHNLEEDLDAMRSRRGRGLSWRQIVSTSGPGNPLSVVTKIAANIGQASGALRRALARALRDEGMQITEIAELFEVSRQRVSALVRPRRTGGQ